MHGAELSTGQSGCISLPGCTADTAQKLLWRGARQVAKRERETGDRDLTHSRCLHLYI